MCASSRTPRKSLLLDIPIAGRCAWIALQRCDLGGHKYGVTIDTLRLKRQMKKSSVKVRLVLGDVLAWHARTGHKSFSETRRFCRDHFQDIGLLDKLIVAALEILDADPRSAGQVVAR